MGKFINGMVVGALALYIYQQSEKNDKPSTLKEAKSSIKNLKASLHHLTNEALPQFNRTMNDVNKTVSTFMVQEQPRFIRIQQKAERLGEMDRP
ncbi:hypothetical protein J7S27_01415 [Carnobacteriaceae bacterium zg-C25]|nr:hypothetical protein J7S27_01415 [Carnobacteriaceae bacterium zg-C25]